MAGEKKNGTGVFGYVRAFVRLWRALGKKQYRVFPWRTLGMAVFAIVYFILPFDFDWVPFIGYIDDAAMFGFVVASVKKDIDRFLDWEAAPDAKQIAGGK